MIITSIKKFFCLIGVVLGSILGVILLAGIGYLTVIVGAGLSSILLMIFLIIVFGSGVIEHFKEKQRPDD